MIDPSVKAFWITVLFMGVALAVFLGLVVIDLFSTKTFSERLESDKMAIVQGNSLLPISPVYIPHTMVYGSLIDCLIFYESSGNPNAVGEANEKGILQFKDSTFQQYCVDKYELGKNIWNCNTQKVCADKMIQDNLGFHWTTYELCN